MTDEKPLTKSDLVAALKEAGFATKEDVSDIVHNELTEFHANITNPKFDQLRDEIKSVASKVDRLDVKVSAIKDDVEGLKAELSVKASRKQLEKLKERVGQLEGFHRH